MRLNGAGSLAANDQPTVPLQSSQPSRLGFVNKSRRRGNPRDAQRGAVGHRSSIRSRNSLQRSFKKLWFWVPSIFISSSYTVCSC